MNKLSVNERKQHVLRLFNKHPDRVPVIMEKSSRSTLPDLPDKKYLVPFDMQLCQFTMIIRKKLNLDPSMALFVMVGGNMCTGTRYMSEVYEWNKSECGFLFLTYCEENTFGSTSV